jgi:hypothetical protein
VLEKIGLVHQGQRRVNNSDEDFYAASALERNGDES